MINAFRCVILDEVAIFIYTKLFGEKTATPIPRLLLKYKAPFLPVLSFTQVFSTLMRVTFEVSVIIPRSHIKKGLSCLIKIPTSKNISMSEQLFIV